VVSSTKDFATPRALFRRVAVVKSDTRRFLRLTMAREIGRTSDSLCRAEDPHEVGNATGSFDASGGSIIPPHIPTRAPAAPPQKANIPQSRESAID